MNDSDTNTQQTQPEVDLRTVHSGLYGLCLIGRHHQQDMDMRQLMHDHAVGGEELSLKELARIAAHHQLKAKCVGIAWKAWEKYQPVLPCLARKTDGHYAIICGLRKERPPETVAAEENAEEQPKHDKNGYEIGIVDPAWMKEHPTEQFRFLKKDEYEAEFTGECLLVKRVWSITDENQPFGLRWFIPEFLKLKGVFAQIALAVFLLTLIALASPLFFQNVVDKVLVHESFSTLNVLGAGIVVAIVFNAILEYLKGHLLLFATNKIDISTAVKTFAHLIHLPIDFFEQMPSGVLLKHMQQTEKIRGFLSGNLFFTLLDLCSLVIFIPFLLLYSVKLTFVVLGFTGLMALVITSLIKPFQRRLAALYQAEGRRQSRLVEAIHGIRTVKSLALEPKEEKEWGNRSAAAVNAYFSVGRISLTARSLSQALEMLMTVAIIWLGATMVFRGDITVGALIAFQMLAGRVTGPLVKLVGLIHEYQQVALSVKMLGAVMNTPTEPNMGRVRAPLRGGIAFENVSFRYRADLPLAIRDFSLEIPPGGSLGIVGRSGSGKTTLTKLLQGLYPPFSGLVKIDGIDIREIEKSHLRSSIGVVLQENYFFQGTVRENIRLTKPSATAEEVVNAANLAGAHDFVQTLPQGYDTPIGENGVRLSGGERQRISIARALLKDAPIVLLDEATASLDVENETRVQGALSRLLAGKTVLVIAHRMRTVMGADKVVVLEGGRVAEQGSPQDLLAANGVFARMVRLQTESASWVL